MTIEIQQPELEALILERMRAGAFANVEDVLIDALKSAPIPSRQSGAAAKSPEQTGAELVKVLQESPYKEICLEPARYPMPVRDVTL